MGKNVATIVMVTRLVEDAKVNTLPEHLSYIKMNISSNEGFFYFYITEPCCLHLW